MNDSIENIKTIFSRTIDHLPIKQEFKARKAMFHWSDIAGSDIAAQSEPLKLEYRILWLGVNNSVWSHHLMMMKRQLINKFNKYVNEVLIDDIKFVNAVERKKFKLENAAEPENIGRELKKIAINEADSRNIKAMVSSIQDDALRRRAAALFRDDIVLKKYKQKKGYSPCKSCGVLCAAEYCIVCSREARQARIQELRKLLNDLPWFSYAEINKQLSCSSYEYIDAKISLQSFYASKLPKEAAIADLRENSDLIMLTMLFKSVSYDKITDELMQHTYKKFRRRF